MNKKQIYFSLLFGFVLLCFLALYIYKDLNFKSNTTEKNKNVATTTVDVLSTGGNEGFVVEQISLDPPVLNKGIIFYGDFAKQNSETKKIMTEKIKNIENVLKNNPDDFDSWIILGGYRKIIGDYGSAVEIWNYAGLIRPGNSISFNNLGDLYHYFIKDYQKAESNFLKSIENDSNYIISYLNLHDLYKLSYKTETNKAEEIILKGLKIEPNNIDLLSTLAFYYKSKNNFKNAIIYFEKAQKEAERLGNEKLALEIKQEILNINN